MKLIIRPTGLISISSGQFVNHVLGTLRRQRSLKLLFLSILIACLSGCERINQVIQPDGTTAPMETTLKIGVIQPSNVFTTFSQGAETARHQINNQGGVLGRQVEFITRNNQPVATMPPTPESSVVAATELIEEANVFALLGPVYSSNAVVVGPIAQKARRLMLPGSSSSTVPKIGEYVFLITVPNALQGKVMARFAMDTDELNAKTAAIIYEADDVYSEDLVQAFRTAFEDTGGQILYMDTYTVGDTTFMPQLTQIAVAEPDVIFCPSFLPEVPLLINEARQLGIKNPFLGGSAWDDREQFLSILDNNSVLDGSYYPTNFSVAAEDEAVQEFVGGYTALFGSPPDGIAASGYDAMRLLALAIETAGSLDAVAVQRAFAAVKAYKGATTISHYDENRQPVKSLAIQTYRGGQVELYKIAEP